MQIAIIILAVAFVLPLGAKHLPAQCCGDCNDDQQVTVDELVTAVGNALEGCAPDGQACRCTPLRTGQETSYAAGDDGDLQAGRRLRYVDNGDGTITDLNTGLMWEKKRPGTGCLNCLDDAYTWSAALGDWIDRMNGLNGKCALRDDEDCRQDEDCPPTPDPFPPDFCVFPEPFAGHRDWRVPNLRELGTLVDYGQRAPSVDPVFHSNCRGGCSELVCACTRPAGYWSSTTLLNSATVAWFIEFDLGRSQIATKPGVMRVRAVRSAR